MENICTFVTGCNSAMNSDEPTHIKCHTCREIKPVSDFYQRTNGKYATRCKICEAIRVAEL